MSRRNAREQALTWLYQCDLRKCEPSAVWEEFCEFSDPQENFATEEEDISYARELVGGVWEHREQIDGKISRNSHNWELGRLSAPLRAILRLAVYEIGWCDRVPVPVAVNEAIELAKEYDNPQAGSFLNGILAGVLREAEE